MIDKLKKISIVKIIEVTLCILIIIQAIIKGGFYNSDMVHVFVITGVITLIYVVVKIIKKELKLGISNLFLGILFIAYVLPVIFNKYTSFSQAVWESFKYLELFAVFLIISNSENKRKYEILLVVLGVIIGILGIDSISKRLFANVLSTFGSGYLSSYLERLSSTIQYANTCSIILMTSFIASVKLFIEYIKKILNDYTVQNITKGKYLFASSGFILTCIFLTQSRFPILLTAIATIILLIILKEKNMLSQIISVISIYLISMISSGIINSFIYGKYEFIYLISAIEIVLFVVIYHIILSKVIMNVKLWYIIDEVKKINLKKIVIVSSIFVAVYLILAFNITVPLSIEASDKDIYVERDIKINDTSDLIDVKMDISKKTEDAKYTIEVYEEKKDNTRSIISVCADYSSEDGKHMSKLRLSDITERIIFRIKCTEGKITVNSILVNNTNVKLSYLLIPSDLVFRTHEKLLGSTSTLVRIEYIKDAFKIFNTSPIIGRGGEAFRNLYKQFQTGEYNSTEVHSSYIQILIESGVIGFVAVLSFTIFVIVKGKNKVYKMIFIIFAVHSIFDLNFSYAISTMIFALLGAMSLNYEEKVDNEKKVV